MKDNAKGSSMPGQHRDDARPASQDSGAVSKDLPAADGQSGRERAETVLDVRATPAGKTTAVVTVTHGQTVLAVETLNLFRSRDRTRLADKVLGALPGIDRATLEHQLEAMAASLQAKQGRSEKTTTTLSPKDSGTTARLMDFLRELKPRYRTQAGEIYFGRLGRAIRPAKVYALDGAVEFVRQTPEWLREQSVAGIKPSAEIRLAKELFIIAGERLATVLPVENADHHAADIATQVRGDLIHLLIEPRVLRSGASDRLSFAGWAVRSAPDAVWRQSFGHPVYALRTQSGAIRLAIRSEYMRAKMAGLGKAFSNTAHAAQFLYQHNLLVKHAQGSLPIRVHGRQFRVWEIAPDIISEACGECTPGAGDERPDTPDLYPEWTDAVSEGHSDA
ncbi:MAG: hypothetical protein NTW87_11145 [Planctomycetota bacterium]|nr:hypothetical protein [Planctomycetota bacterium]